MVVPAVYLGVTLLLVGLGSGEDCMAVAAGSAQLGTMVGGWKPVNLPASEDGTDEDQTLNMMTYAQLALKEWSLDQDTEYTVDHIKEAYSQVVAGVNYCISFTAKAKSCGENDITEECSKGLNCETEVFIGLPLLRGTPQSKISDVDCFQTK